MKPCNKCGTVKDLSCFSKDKVKADGHKSNCKDCCAVNDKKWRSENLEHCLEVSRGYKEKHVKPFRSRRMVHNPNARGDRKRQGREAVKRFATNNPGKINAKTARRKKYIKKATPSWADLKYIELFYVLAKLEEQRTGMKCHVDHIVPLQSEFVCGLHNEFNLQVMFANQNQSKGNRVWPNMPSA